MTTLLIDLGVIGIVVFCAWRGYRNGLIRGAFGVVALLASLFLANTIARTYANEFTGVLTPFASGIIESTLFSMASEDDDIIDIDLDNIDIGNVDLGDIDIAELDFGNIDLEGFNVEEFDLDNISITSINNAPERFIASYFALRQLGMLDAASTQIAQVSSEDESGGFFPVVVGDTLSLYLSYIALFGISFLLLSIAFTVIGNLINVVLTLPNLKLVDNISGVAFGFVKGFIIILAIGVVVRYYGLLFHEIIEATSFLKHIANNNILADVLGV